MIDCISKKEQSHEKLAIISVSDNAAVIESPQDITATLIFATYNPQGRLVSVDVKRNASIAFGSRIYGANADFNAMGGADVAVMLWDSTENMLPLCAAWDTL